MKIIVTTKIYLIQEYGPNGPQGLWTMGPIGGAWGLGKATYSQAKLPTVRQSYLLSGKATYCQACTQPLHRLAPNNRIHAPKSPHIHGTHIWFKPHTQHLCIASPLGCGLSLFASAQTHCSAVLGLWIFDLLLLWCQGF